MMNLSAGATVLASALVLIAVPSASRAQEPRGSWSSDKETFRWKGKVDGSDDIIIHGNTVRIDHISAKRISNEHHKFSAPLPRAEVDVDLRVIKGRGDVRLMERPSSRNNYTAVVRVDDEDKGGASDYEFELSWEDDYNSDDYRGSSHDAVFRWRGKVDIACEIEISGRIHREKDEGGSGTHVSSATFTEALPFDEVPVHLKKRKGRGNVELVQSPSRRNSYTAIVRIEDDKGGSSDYDFELRWPRQ